MFVVEILFEENNPTYRAFSKFEDAEELYIQLGAIRHEDRSPLKSGDFIKHLRILKVSDYDNAKKAVEAVKSNSVGLFDEIKSTAREDEERLLEVDKLLKEHGVID